MERRHIYALYELADKAPRILGVSTGTKLDSMFYVYEKVEGRLTRRVLNGIPYLSVMNIVGSPDTGKSLFSIQFAIYQAAKGYRVSFLTTETPAKFLYNTIKERAQVMDKDFDAIARNIYIVDVSEEEELRQYPKRAWELLKDAIKLSGSTITVIDSITGLYESKEIDARRIVRLFYNGLKGEKQTALLISQKRRSQEAATVEAAGGLGVAHIVDGSIVLDKKLILTKYDESVYGSPIGSVIRTIRIDGCRLAGHDQRTYILNISDAGKVEVGEELSVFMNRNREKYTNKL